MGTPSGAVESVEPQRNTINLGPTPGFPADRPHGYRKKQETSAVFHDLIRYAQVAARRVPGDTTPN